MKIYIVSFFIGLFFLGCGGSDVTGNPSSVSAGISGSKARFSIVGDYLYTINADEMNIFDVTDTSSPLSVSKVHIPFDVETIFAYSNYLYIGASLGFYIYDTTNPTQPTKITNFTHVNSCDPVVVENDIAYVTLNSGNSCFNDFDGVNRLEVIDVRNPKNPELIRTLDMWEPGGLAIDNDNLFICDGNNGLKVFDVNRSEVNGTITVGLNLLESNSKVNCYDVIANSNSLVISNRSEILQFDYSSYPMEELGKIE